MTRPIQYKVIDLDTNHELTFDDYIHAFTEYKHQLDKKSQERENVHSRLVLCAYTSTELRG